MAIKDIIDIKEVKFGCRPASVLIDTMDFFDKNPIFAYAVLRGGSAYFLGRFAGTLSGIADNGSSAWNKEFTANINRKAGAWANIACLGGTGFGVLEGVTRAHYPRHELVKYKKYLHSLKEQQRPLATLATPKKFWTKEKDLALWKKF